MALLSKPLNLINSFSKCIRVAMALITTSDAASRLGITVQRVHALIKGGRLPATKLGRDYGINDADLKLVKNRKPGRPPKAAAYASRGLRERRKGSSLQDRSGTGSGRKARNR
jgi:excisionase family DNA binding protein